METYSASHSVNAERALLQGRSFVATFVKVGAGRLLGRSAMLFAGLYRNHGGILKTKAEISDDPEVDWLRKTFGYFPELDDPSWTEGLWFNLQLDDQLQELQGRLVIDVRLTQSYVRLADRLDAPVSAIHAESAFDAAPPNWRKMRPSAGMLRALPSSWASRLREWRGIYMIIDESDGARYVGSAYGEDVNLLGRWQQHVAGDAGVTVQLAQRDPVNFRFSILERVSPDMLADDVIRIERTWMDRLDTIRYGLNT